MWRGEKALNLVANIADTPTIGIEICQLEVRGLTLLLHFDGLHLQFRAQHPRNSPLFISTVGSQLLGQKVRPRTQVLGKKVRPGPENGRKL